MTTQKTVVSKAKTPVKRAPAKKPTSPVLLDKKALATVEKKVKKDHKKVVVRDSFTMPQSEYAKIAEIKSLCLKAKMHVKKSEVLRAGLKLLSELNAAQLKLVLGSLEKIKTGRPQKP